MSTHDPDAWDGAVEMLAAVKGIPMRVRLEAFALACDVFCKTNGTVEPLREGESS